MTILIVGATGATGKLLTSELLRRGHQVKVIVRAPDKLPEFVESHKNCTVITASLPDLEDSELEKIVRGCYGVASCLGHNLSWKGIYGQPRRLVTESVSRICAAIEKNKPSGPVRFVLMNTAGNSNRDLYEYISIGQRFVLWLLRLLLPPHVDNEMAADFLRTKIGQDNDKIKWVAVRPDTLINEEGVTPYEVHESPVRSALFNAGKTSRINVAHFMAELLTDDEQWNKWKGQMPVIYNSD